MTYEAPTVVRFGTVTGLTSSTLKCSPGPDTYFGKTYGEESSTAPWEELDGDNSIFPPEIPKGQVPTACMLLADFKNR